MKKAAICATSNTSVKDSRELCEAIGGKIEECFEQVKKAEAARRSDNKERFKMELTQLINKYSLENDSDTPDWILADYIVRSLEVFAFSHKRCNDWHDDRKRVK